MTERCYISQRYRRKSQNARLDGVNIYHGPMMQQLLTVLCTGVGSVGGGWRVAVASRCAHGRIVPKEIHPASST